MVDEARCEESRQGADPRCACAGRWRGEAEPIDPRSRIPGSLNRFNSGNLTPEGVQAGRRRAELDGARWQGIEVVHSCGSCRRLPQPAGMEVAGLEGGKLYAGSWSEWIADPQRPRERG
jgi:thiosulfate/3-mercaptopyruvate sulfurtransferase